MWASASFHTYIAETDLYTLPRAKITCKRTFHYINLVLLHRNLDMVKAKDEGKLIFLFHLKIGPGQKNAITTGLTHSVSSSMPIFFTTYLGTLSTYV